MRSTLWRAATDLMTELALGTPFRHRFRRVGSSAAVIFTLHRVAMPEAGIGGHGIPALRRLLSRLRKLRVPVVEVGDIVAATQGRRSLPAVAVSFTLDDGYWDQADITVPVLLEYDVLPTVFLITGFMDGDLWPWDARLREYFRIAKQPRIQICAGSSRLNYDLSTPAARQRSRRSFDALCKSVPEDRREELLVALAEAAGSDPHLSVPAAHRAMGWDRARELEVLGVRFGPHSVSHCVFSGASDERALAEIQGSLVRIRSELRHPLPVFAWPIGRAVDFGRRDIEAAARVGFSASVSMEPRDVDLTDAWPPSELIVLPRYGFPDSNSEALRLVFGLTGPGGASGQRPTDFDARAIDRLIFVCKGNICRSPYAEVVAANMGMNALSCGIEAAPGSRADPEALRNAAIRDFDLSAHASRRLDEMELKPGDLVVYMEPGQAGPVRRHTQPAGAQHTIASAWISGGGSRIVDPFGRDDVTFQAVFDQLDEVVSNIVRRINTARQSSDQAVRQTD